MRRHQTEPHKITKEYLKTKLKGSLVVVWILLGFIGGTTMGGILFQTSNKDIIRVQNIY